MLNVECWLGGLRFVECNLSSNDSAKKVQTRTELSLLKLCRVQPFLNHDAKIRQFPDTTKFQRVIRRDFQHAFNLKPVKQSNSPFCAPQLILFQKRKHRVKEKKTQHLIQYSVIQFFFKGLLFTPLKSKVYILSIYLYI